MSGTNARIERLFERRHAGVKLGLELIGGLLEALEHPEHSFAAVHVAGTNGKGSTCAMIEALLRAHGFKTGLFTSPHLVRFHERIRVNGLPVGDETLAACMDRMEAVEGRLPRLPTFFESSTALAYLAFARAGVQIAVIEVGIGGRWDATNTLTPLLSVVTPIGLDHTGYLGNTLPEIAGEKAGIIKPGRPVVVSRQDEAAMAVLVRAASERGCLLRTVKDHMGLRVLRSDATGQVVQAESTETAYGRIKLALAGPYQAENLGTSLLALEEIMRQVGREVDLAAVKSAMDQVRFPGRLQLLRRNPPLFLDVAHNPHGAEALAGALRALFPRQKGRFVLGVMADKDLDGILRALLPLMEECRCVAVDHPRALAAATLASRVMAAGARASACSVAEAVDWLKAGKGPFGCVAGSVYLAGAVLALEEGPGHVPEPGETLLG